MTASAYQALIRFGMGRRGAEPLPDNPRAWLLAQLAGPDPAQFPPQLPTTADGLIVLREQNKLHLGGPDALVPALLRQDIRAQTEQALTTTAGFRERLVWFWANHFTVSTKGGGGGAVVGPYVREAIRPNVTNPFLAMLLAVMRHPAMLMYLDNGSSIGPNSPAGLKQKKGLNENLARECLELHTLGVNGGYTQADVTSFAAILTGWSVDQGAARPGFIFRPEAHEPGEKTLLGHRFPEGEVGGLMALEMLAFHPATHRHLATKLARHFVADSPTPDSIRPIEAALRDTNADLAAAAAALVDIPAAWQPLTKIRAAADFVIAALRALDLPQHPAPEAGMALLGEPLWTAPLPNGFADDAASWTGPESAMRRVDWSYALAGRAAAIDPAAVAGSALGPLLRPQTRAAMANAGARRDSLTIFLTAAEFQRR